MNEGIPTNLKGISFCADYISQLSRILVFSTKYHKIFSLRNLICAKYQVKYIKNENGWQKLDNNNISVIPCFLSINNKRSSRKCKYFLFGKLRPMIKETRKSRVKKRLKKPS